MVATSALLLIVRGQGSARGALLGFGFGLTAFGLLLSWISRFGALPWSALVLLSASYVALFGATLPFVVRGRHPAIDAIATAALWTLIAWVRGHWPRPSTSTNITA